MSSCKICGKEYCKKHSVLLSKIKKVENFSGSSPPEIFVGKWNYPNVYAGILSPEVHGDTLSLSSAEIWHKNKLSIEEIIKKRNELIYGRMQNHIKTQNNNFLSVLKEVAMTHKSVSTEFKLKKPVSKNPEKEPSSPLITNAAEVEKVRLEENPSVKTKVDYLVADVHAKSKTAILELEEAHIETSSIIKILSAGLIGIGPNRKLVPTRWSITAVDDILSKEKLKEIRYFKEISEIELFYSEYLGNHYEFLLLPNTFAFEVVEISLKTSESWHDYETFFQRKKYAESVTGAYYANRLALTEYLVRIKKQAQCIVFREIRPEYSSPLGVGILREISREAFNHSPKKFANLKDALIDIQSRLKKPVSDFTSKSLIINELNKQRKLNQFF